MRTRTVPTLPRSNNPATIHELGLRGLLMAIMWMLATTSVFGQNRPTHRLSSTELPPGAVGRQRLLRGGHVRDFFQPVRVTAPPDTVVAVAQAGTFDEAYEQSLTVGLMVGEVYRFEVTGYPHPESALYPTVELIGRLYPPPGAELRFPVPVELTAEELRLAAAGKFVTRVIYVEDPDNALPVNDSATTPQRYFEVFEHEDPLTVAYELGRPIAILRVGSRRPGSDGDENFLYGCPPVQNYEAVPHVLELESEMPLTQPSRPRKGWMPIKAAQTAFERIAK